MLEKLFTEIVLKYMWKICIFRIKNTAGYMLDIGKIVIKNRGAKATENVMIGMVDLKKNEQYICICQYL